MNDLERGDSQATLAVVIPTWHRPEKLTTLLTSLHGQKRQPDEILIVCRSDDGESINAVEDWAKASELGLKHKVVRVHESGHLPPLVGALEICQSEVFCLVDDDALPRNDWLEKLENDFKDPRVGGIGGMVVDHKGGDSKSVFNQTEILTPGKLSWFGRSKEYGRMSQTNPNLFEADYLLGANMAFRTKALVDCIDLRLNGGSAPVYEIDIALNLRQKGYRLFYDPEVLVDHYPAPSKTDIKTRWNQKQCFWYAHNLSYVCLKHLSWYGKLAFLLYFYLGGQWHCPGPIIYLLGLVRCRPVSWREQFLPSLKGRFAGAISYAKRT